MARFSIFSTPSHQKFQYRPRYWDPKKDETEAFKARIREVQGQDVEGTKARITSGLKTGYGGDPLLRAQLKRKSNIRIMGFIGILFLVSYWLVTKYMDQFIQWVEH